MLKFLLWIAASPVAAALLAVGVGLLLPRDHVAVVDAHIGAPPHRVAALIRNVAAQSEWRSGVTRIDVSERRENRLRYVEHSGSDRIAFDFIEDVPGRRFRSVIADPSLPFGGQWTIGVEPHGAGTRVRIEERGFVTNPVYRFFAALVFGHERTMRTYLSDLRQALSGSTSEPSA
jgi:hypothetical protein